MEKNVLPPVSGLGTLVGNYLTIYTRVLHSILLAYLSLYPVSQWCYGMFFFLKLFFLIYLKERKRDRERVSERLAVPLIYEFMGWFLCVP